MIEGILAIVGGLVPLLVVIVNKRLKMERESRYNKEQNKINDELLNPNSKKASDAANARLDTYFDKLRNKSEDSGNK